MEVGGELVKHGKVGSRSRRHDKQTKHGGMFGHSSFRRPKHTSKHTVDLAFDPKMILTSDRPRGPNGEIAVTALDEKMGVDAREAFRRDYLRTLITPPNISQKWRLEMVAENRSKFEKVEEALESGGSRVARQRRRGSARTGLRDDVETAFDVPIVGYIAPPAAGDRKRDAATQFQLFSDPGQGIPRPLYSLPGAPPREVVDASLMAQARVSVDRSCRSANRRVEEEAYRRLGLTQHLRGWDANRARVTHFNGGSVDPDKWADLHRSAWLAVSSDSALVVDLRSEQQVSAVSTMGRHPRTRRFPLSRAEAAEVADSAPTSSRKFDLNNPVQVVLEDFAQWVTRFELSARAHGGREWLMLGEFRGNSDGTSEAAHVLPHGGLKCRFLRFRPLAWHGKEGGAPGALRVGVYGPGGAASSTAGGTEAVRYTLARPLSATEVNTRRKVRTESKPFRERGILKRHTKLASGQQRSWGHVNEADVAIGDGATVSHGRLGGIRRQVVLGERDVARLGMSELRTIDEDALAVSSEHGEDDYHSDNSLAAPNSDTEGDTEACSTIDTASWLDIGSAASEDGRSVSAVSSSWEMLASQGAVALSDEEDIE